MSKLCKGKCNLVKDTHEFYDKHNKCKTCYNESQKSSINTDYMRFFMKLKNSAQSSVSNKRSKVIKFSLDISDIIALHENQKGLCYYSKVPYVFKQLSDWKCSIERLDPKQGYVTGNVALIIAELQTRTQWTPDKFKEFLYLLNNNHEKQNINWNSCFENITYQKIDKTIIIIDSVEHMLCRKCNIVKPIDTFLLKSLFVGCEICRKKHSKLYRASPMGNMKKILSHMKDNSKLKAKQRNFPLCKLKIDDLIEIFENQGGLCYYTGIPMTFGSYKDRWWTASPERKNVNKGYTKDNICFICYEFNTGDRTSLAKTPEEVCGCSGWSKKKIEYVNDLNKNDDTII